jgi:hypothetical protein
MGSWLVTPVSTPVLIRFYQGDQEFLWVNQPAQFESAIQLAIQGYRNRLQQAQAACYPYPRLAAFATKSGWPKSSIRLLFFLALIIARDGHCHLICPRAGQSGLALRSKVVVCRIVRLGSGSLRS